MDSNKIKGERVLARQFARELDMTEIDQVAGQMKQTCDKYDPTGMSYCTPSDGNPCDMDTWLGS